MTAIDAALPAARPPRRLQIFLVVMAAAIALGALRDIPTIFYDYAPTTTLGAFAQNVASVKLALAPLIAIAALAFAIGRRPRQAIVALAALVLLDWLSELPTIAIHGLSLSASIPGAEIFAQWFVYPLLAAAAIALAIRDIRLPLAAFLVTLPTFIFGAEVIAFAVGVAIHGF